METSLNASAICSSLPELDIKDIAKLIGLDLPDIPGVDTVARWDQSRHDVTALQVDGSSVQANITFGCQPSDESAVIQLLGMSGDDFRLKDDGACNGSIAEGNVVSASCTVSGEIGKRLAGVVNLDQVVSEAVTASIP